MKLKIRLIPSIAGTKVFDRLFITEDRRKIDAFVSDLLSFAERTNTPLDVWWSEDVIGYQMYVKWAPAKVR